MLKIVFFKQRILNASLYNLAHALLFYIRLHMKQMRLHGTVVDERDRLCSEVFLKDPSLDPLLFQLVLFALSFFQSVQMTKSQEHLPLRLFLKNRKQDSYK